MECDGDVEEIAEYDDQECLHFGLSLGGTSSEADCFAPNSGSQYHMILYRQGWEKRLQASKEHYGRNIIIYHIS